MKWLSVKQEKDIFANPQRKKEVTAEKKRIACFWKKQYLYREKLQGKMHRIFLQRPDERGFSQGKAEKKGKTAGKMPISWRIGRKNVRIFRAKNFLKKLHKNA